jgi:hypothetical protein
MTEVYEDHFEMRMFGFLFDVRVVGAGKNRTPGVAPHKLRLAMHDTGVLVRWYRDCLAWDQSVNHKDVVEGEDIATLGLLVNCGTMKRESQVAAVERSLELRGELEDLGEKSRLWIDLDGAFEREGLLPLYERVKKQGLLRNEESKRSVT